MFMSWLLFLEVEEGVVELQVRRLPNQWPEFKTAFGSVTPLDILKTSENLQPFMSKPKTGILRQNFLFSETYLKVFYA